MTDTQRVIPGLPTARGCPFDPPTELGDLRSEAPITRMRYPDGHLGWLVTTYELACEVLSSSAFSARHDLRHFPVPLGGRFGPAAPGVFIGMDPPDHTRYRKALSKAFTTRRIRELDPDIARITTQCLDAMERDGSPADLVKAFALPLPVLVISTMMGASPQVAEELQRLRVPVLSPQTPPEVAAEAGVRITELMRELIRAKHRDGSGGLLGELIGGGELDDEELAGIALLMIGAGHETTANLIALGVYFLLRNEDKKKAIAEGPLTDGVVNELLRYLSIVQFVSRAAQTDVVLGGVAVKAGDTVTISIPAVNRDECRFDDPADFDPSGTENSHLAFGYSLHQCLGHNLARAEIRIGIGELLRRFPGLRMADPAQHIPTRDAMNIYGVHELPVAW